MTSTNQRVPSCQDGGISSDDTFGAAKVKETEYLNATESVSIASPEYGKKISTDATIVSNRTAEPASSGGKGTTAEESPVSSPSYNSMANQCRSGSKSPQHQQSRSSSASASDVTKPFLSASANNTAGMIPSKGDEDDWVTDWSQSISVDDELFRHPEKLNSIF